MLQVKNLVLVTRVRTHVLWECKLQEGPQLVTCALRYRQLTIAVQLISGQIPPRSPGADHSCLLESLTVLVSHALPVLKLSQLLLMLSRTFCLCVFATAGPSPTCVVVTCLCVFLSHHTLSLWKVGLFFYLALDLMYFVGFNTHLLI
jgi:hypothetical protein